MKKIILFLMMSIISVNSFAGFYDSDYFEPIILGGTLATVGYVTSKDNQAMMAGVGFGAGLLIGFGLNSYYRSKIDAVNNAEIAEKEAIIDQKKAKYAHRANSGDLGLMYSLQTQMIEDGQATPDGKYISPGFKTKIEEP